jgi:hypothetical protein
MPKVYGSYKTGADIYKDPKYKKFYILEWNPQTRETYKKIINFKPITTIRKTRPKKPKTQKTQKGGQPHVPGQMTMDMCSVEILNTDSYKSILAQLQLPDGINEYLASNIQKIRDEYEAKFASKRLVDVIYDLPQSRIKPVLGQLAGQMPKMCWDHGIDNSTSITGGAPGIHVYIANFLDAGWQLVGIFNKTINKK